MSSKYVSSKYDGRKLYRHMSASQPEYDIAATGSIATRVPRRRSTRSSTNGSTS